MATDGPDPTPCNKEVFANGTQVFMTSTIPSNAMEGWVRKVAAVSGQRVDWYFSGGHGLVKNGRHGVAWRTTVQSGMAGPDWLCTVMHGLAGKVGNGAAKRGWARHSRLGEARPCLAWYGRRG